MPIVYCSVDLNPVSVELIFPNILLLNHQEAINEIKITLHIHKKIIEKITLISSCVIGMQYGSTDSQNLFGVSFLGNSIFGSLESLKRKYT